MAEVLTRIGPADAGRTMPLKEFAHVEGEPGYLYELARGVIEVVDLPGLSHAMVLQEVRDQLVGYKLRRADVIRFLGGGGEAGMQLDWLNSERHPDLSIYLTPPPDTETPWGRWIPNIAVEIVSPSSERRDYHDKREEYLLAGVREYWIIDPRERAMLVLRRDGNVWRERPVAGDAAYQTHLLPGFVLDLGKVFAAAEG